MLGPRGTWMPWLPVLPMSSSYPSPPVTLLQKTSPEEPCHLSEIPINCHTLCLSAVMLWHRGRQTRCSLQEQRPHETRKEEAILGRLGIKMQHSPSSGNKFGRHHHMLTSECLLPPMDLMHSLGHALPSAQSQQAPEWLSQVFWSTHELGTQVPPHLRNSY